MQQDQSNVRQKYHSRFRRRNYVELNLCKLYCYTSQLKYILRLEENVSRAVGQNSLTPRTKLVRDYLSRYNMVLNKNWMRFLWYPE